MAPRHLNPNVITIIAKAIPDQVVIVVDVTTVVLLINQNSVWHMEKNVTGATRKPFFKALQESESTGGGSKAQHQSHHDVHEMEEKEIQFQYGNDGIKIKRTLNNQPKHLQHALTGLKLCNKAGNSHKVHFKLDIGASGKLFPLKNYYRVVYGCFSFCLI